MNVRKAVFPVAGLGTRSLPATQESLNLMKVCNGDFPQDGDDQFCNRESRDRHRYTSVPWTYMTKRRFENFVGRVAFVMAGSEDWNSRKWERLVLADVNSGRFSVKNRDGVII